MNKCVVLQDYWNTFCSEGKCMGHEITLCTAKGVCLASVTPCPKNMPLQVNLMSDQLLQKDCKLKLNQGVKKQNASFPYPGPIQ